jgi:PKD repeat protein
VAALKPNETQICQGETISFANNSQSANTYQWWIGSTLISTNTIFSHTFSTPGQYNVKLIASNGTCSDSTFTHISVRAPLPQPVFTYQKDHLKGWFNTEVPTFASTIWNFGDGSGNQQEVDSITHNFKAIGTYQVCLTETNICGSVTTCENIAFAIDSTFNFVKHYDENSFYNGRRWARGTEALYDGGFLLSGTDDTWGSTGWDGTLVKTDKKGNPLWTQMITYGNGINIEIPHITETQRGYLLLGGTNGSSPYLGIMDSSGLTTYMLRLTTSSQGALSAKPYEKQNGNIIFSGCYGNQAFIAETDLGLGVFWFKRHTGIRTLYATIKTSVGYLMAGTDLTNTQIGLMKLDENGDYVSAAIITHTGSTPTAARDIVASLDGNFIVTGNSNGALYLMKVDSNYNVHWTKKYSVTGFGKSLSIDNSGNIIVLTTGGVVVKTDPLGNVIWAWDPPGSSIYGSVRHGKTLDGGLIVAGTTYGYFSSLEEELSLFRFDNSGNLPSCWGSPITVTATSITANVSNATDVQTDGIPSLTKNYTGNSYSSLQAEICASAMPFLEADFTVEIGCAGNPTAFTNSSSGTVVSHNWSFQGAFPASSTSMNPSVTWNTPGIYTVSLTITGSDGSMNTQTMDISIGATPTANAGSDVITCEGTPIVLNGSGTGTLTWNSSSSMPNPTLAVTSVNPLANELFVLQAVSGNCSVTDTVMVTVNLLFMDTTAATICSGMSYSFQGQNFMSSGIYSIPYMNINGCDSTYTLNLTVNPPLISTISAFICDGADYTVGTSVFSTTGAYTIALQNQAGCDSIVNLNLTVILPATTVNAEICSGENYLVGSTSFSIAGTYTINLLNQNGCDSTVTLNLSVLPNLSSTINAEICSGENYLVGSTAVSVSGIHTIVLQSLTGCDSTVTLSLQVLPVSSSVLNGTICSGETYSFNGIDYSVSGTYTAVYASANGCDSIVTLNLDVLFVNSSLTNATICPGDTYLFNGTTYSSPGSYSTILTATNGCDSTALLDLSLIYIPTTDLNASICSGEDYFFNGNTYTQTGTYSATLQSIEGCDSIVILNLTVLDSPPTFINEAICYGESYLFQGNVYSSAGVYSDTLQTINGCDSVFVLDLTVLTINTGVSVSGTTLTANQTGATYEWINCDDLTVVGTQQSFIGNVNSNYAVVVAWNNCSDTSDCYLVSDLSIANLASSSYSVYPVPSDDIIYLISPLEAKGQQYILYDEAGRTIFTGIIEKDKTIISLEKYSFGVYQLKVGNEGRLFKVIRQ